jgi:tRNA modification GTPase
MRRTQRALAESDVALLVVDGSIPSDANDDALHVALTGHRAIIVRSKADLPRHPDSGAGPQAVAVSATTGAGLPLLLDWLAAEVARVTGDVAEEGQVAATLRQVDGLEGVSRSLGAALTALGSMPLEVALVDLREALNGSSALLGIELGDAVLDRIFSTFCVGK